MELNGFRRNFLLTTFWNDGTGSTENSLNDLPKQPFYPTPSAPNPLNLKTEKPSTLAQKKLYLLDGYALIYRAFYSMGKNFLYTSSGINTTAVRGFTTTLQDLIVREQPTHIALVMDCAGPTDRAVEHSFYKANRQAMPDELRDSIPYIRRVAEGFNMPILEKPGFEADDVIGTMAKQAEQEGFEVYMVTPDKDFGQLVSENIFMYKPGRKGSPPEIWGVEEILDKWDIERVEQVIDVLGLMGDASDNIPGIPGVGEKTAIKLLKQFDSVENLLENTDQLKGKLKEKVETNADKAIISKKLATIILDVPVEYDFNDLTLDPPDREALEELFAELEFRSLGKRLLGEQFNVNTAKAKLQEGDQLDMFGGAVNEMNAELLGGDIQHGRSIDSTEHKYHLVADEAGQRELAKQLNQQEIVCFDTETTGVDPNNCDLVGMAFTFAAGEAYYVPVSENIEAAQETVEIFRPFFENENIGKIGQNLKFDMLVMRWYDIELAGPLDDTMLQHYLIQPESKHNLTHLAETYLGYTPVPIEDLIGKKGKNQGSMRDVPVEKVAQYAGEDTDVTFQLYQKFEPQLSESNLQNLYRKVEMPTMRVLAEMEYNGVKIDDGFLNDFAKKLKTESRRLQQEIFDLAGETFNVDSTKQLGHVLFDKMEIPYRGKRNTKSGNYSTAENVLQRLVADHPIAALVLDYRGLKKLSNTYVEALPKLINPRTGLLHTTFNQAVASTGRLSSSNPNLQNIPIRTELGRKIRQAFIPRSEKHQLLAADYSQVELRLIAEMSGDENMKSAFIDGVDIHAATASKVYDIPLEEVGSDMRRNAKMVNFGIIYGISAFGLAQRLGTGRDEAQALISGYFKQYPDIERYMNEAIDKARNLGYAETLLGRRRYLRDIHSRNQNLRQFAERNAINMPIQGTAAELIKLAMVDVLNAMNERKLQSKMILQVHDELLFDVVDGEMDEMKELVSTHMSGAMQFEVPLVVETGTGANWLEAH